MLRRFAAAADVVFVYAQTEMSRSAAAPRCNGVYTRWPRTDWQTDAERYTDRYSGEERHAVLARYSGAAVSASLL